MQFVEGAMDHNMFENFLYQVLMKLRTDPETKNKRIVVYLDNAKIHKSPHLKEMVGRFYVDILFAA